MSFCQFSTFISSVLHFRVIYWGQNGTCGTLKSKFEHFRFEFATYTNKLQPPQPPSHTSALPLHTSCFCGKEEEEEDDDGVDDGHHFTSDYLFDVDKTEVSDCSYG